jgi:hypothetical protein
MMAKEAWHTRYATAGDLRLQFMDVRSEQTRDPEALKRVLDDALSRLSCAGQGFGELVTSHLRIVVAVDEPADAYILPQSAWRSTFQGQSRTSGHLLACRLIWAATAIRLARDAKAVGRRVGSEAIRKACWAAQRRFLSQFDNAQEWIRYMDPDLDRDVGSGPGAA